MHYLEKSNLPCIHSDDIPLVDEAMESFDFTKYGTHERELLTPAIVAAGYKITGEWHSTECDDFGPLTRGIRVITPEGEPAVVWYG